MAKSNVLNNVLIILLCALVCSCSTIHITEDNFLRDKQQEVLYHLVTHERSSIAKLANSASYSQSQLTATLEKLVEQGLVHSKDDLWSVTEKYKTQQSERFNEISKFDLLKLQSQLTSHQLNITSLQESNVQVASLLAHSANESLLIFPGNGFHLAPDLKELIKLLSPKRNLFVIEYPGMGNNNGPLTVESLKKAANEFYLFVAGHPSTQNTTLNVYGFSLGGFVASEVAASHPVDSLILDSTAPDIQSWIDANVPTYAKLMVNVQASPALKAISNTRSIENLTRPILFISGSDDQVTPPQLMKTIYQSATHASYKKLVLLQGADHGDSLDHTQFSPTIEAFFNHVTKIKTSGMTKRALR
ncbi:alpha/beta fold hydrolase [Pseudoalteromonas sp. MMG022]|uniref:alpha/beta fold hydrolase n=1 Tax=Pseudoalteromonas sp. MMG022 TaxID=2909978 RepID=UPI001F247898|nr:alpha/beta fold hydrolase [Pseudoalteromonas sp. MMG022]MCF6434599.1 hypothetical protein [Pseudoalteromonas sp. MMG022]